MASVGEEERWRIDHSQKKEALPEFPAEPGQKFGSKFYAFACAILGSMSSIMLGYDTGVMSGAQIYIQKDLKINDVQLEILVGTINLFSLIGSALAGRTSDWIGRKYTIVLSCAIFFGSAFLMGLAVNYPMLMFGRFIAGIGVGYALMIAPVYTTELAPASARGFLASFPEVFINFGVLLGYVSNYCFRTMPANVNWRIMLGIGAIPSLGLGIMVVFMPESPRWLVLKGRLGDARRVLVKTSASKEEAQARLGSIQEAAGIPLDCMEEVFQVPKVEKGNEVWKELLLHPTPTVRRIMVAAIGIHFFQQASGIDAVVLYSPKIFKNAGIATESALLGATVGVGVVKTMFILISTFFLDRVGRRPILLTSVGGMIVAVTLLATGLTVIHLHPDRNHWAIGLSVAMVYIYVGFFSMGLGPIAWVYSSEIYPLRLRAQGASLGVGMNRLMSGIIGTTFLSMSKALTTGGSFFLFAGVCILAWNFFYLYLPETRGKNLEDIVALFTKSRWKRGQNDNVESKNGEAV